MNKTRTTEVVNKNTPTNAASPVVSQKPAPTPTTDKSSIGSPVVGAPVTTVDAPMHAAKGNDDIMSQPQASQIEKKKS